MGQARPQKQDPKRNPDGTYKPGVCGNPGGRPKGSVNLMERIRAKLMEEVRGGPTLAADEVAEAVVKLLKKGSALHLKDFLDRDEGKPTQPIDLTGNLSIESMSPAQAVTQQAAALERASLVQPRLAVKAVGKHTSGNGNGKGAR